MNVNELMIGDLVTDKYGRIIKVESITNTGINFEVDREGVVYNGWDEEDILPIRLRDEILDKNGFKRVNNNPDFELDKNTFWYDSTIYTYGETINFDPEVCKCQYVHELQHFLKLLCINKDIEL